MKTPILFASMVFAAATLSAGKVLILEDAEDAKNNFSGKVKITDDAKNSKKAFLVEKRKVLKSKKKFTIDPEKYYVASVWVKAVGDTPSFAYLGIQPFDEKGKYIRNCNFVVINGTSAELAAPCKAGDVVIKIKNGAKLKVHKNYVIAFNTKADKSDLPNYNVSSGIKSIEKKDNVWEITLLKPVTKAYPAETKVREHRMGGYIYPKHGKVPTEWTKWQSRKIKGSQLRKGTTARLVMLCNYSQCKDQNMLFDDLTIEEVEK